MRNHYAFESMFDPEQTTDKLLEAVRANVANSIKTVEQAASLENKLSEEAAMFNDCLTTIANAYRKCERGEITREEMLSESQPCVNALKTKCVALSLANVGTRDDDITEDEIAMLREYIVGCKDIVAARKEEIQDSATEGVLSIMENMDFAMEASDSKLYKMYRKSTEAKTANELYKNAKKLWSMGSKDKAKDYMSKAQDLYEKILEKVKKEAKVYKTEAETSLKSSVIAPVRYDFTSKRKGVEHTDSRAAANLIAYYEDRIISCKAYLKQWDNKAGKSTLAETKAQLKAERKEERKRNREERKDKIKGSFAALKDKFTKKEDAEAIDAIESMIDMLELELQMDAAIESADGYEYGPATEAINIAGKIKAAFAKLARAKKNGDEEAAEKAAEEVRDAAEELKKADDNADTPEEKKKLSTAAKIAIGSAVAAAAGVGATAVGQMLKKRVDAGEIKPNAAVSAIIKASDAVKKHTVDAAKSGIERMKDKSASRLVGREEKRQGKLDAAKKRADNLLVTDAESHREKKSEQLKKIKDDIRGKLKKKRAQLERKNMFKDEIDEEVDTYARQLIDEAERKYDITITGVEESWILNDDILSLLAYGAEGFLTDDDDMIDDAIEMELDDMDELAEESMIAVMMAEDGVEF